MPRRHYSIKERQALPLMSSSFDLVEFILLSNFRWEASKITDMEYCRTGKVKIVEPNMLFCSTWYLSHAIRMVTPYQVLVNSCTQARKFKLKKFRARILISVTESLKLRLKGSVIFFVLKDVSFFFLIVKRDDCRTERGSPSAATP